MSGSLFVPFKWTQDKINIVVVGAGGTGSEFMSQLFKMHFTLVKLGHQGLDVTLVDGDIVAESNVGRQSYWSHDISLKKAKVIIDRFNMFGGTAWTAVTEYITPSYIEKTLGGFNKKADLIVTCVDNAKFRADLGALFRDVETNALWGDCGNCNSQAQVILGHIGNPEKNINRIPNVFDLFPSLATMIDNDSDSCSVLESITKQDFGINLRASAVLINLIWQLVRHGSVDHHGSFIDLKSGTEDPLMVDEAVWNTFGYNPETSKSIALNA